MGRAIHLGIAERLAAKAVTGFARLMTGVRPEWRGCAPETRQRIYFANHASHGDFVLVWSVMPADLRRLTRPVAGGDYWLKTPMRRFMGQKVFNAVLIEREAENRTVDPLDQMAEALDQGFSLILFPEGTRNMTDEALLPFKSGLYNLAMRRPEVDLVPAWIDNISRVLPKGEFLPLPLLCSVTFGEAIRVHENEDRKVFLKRAENALLSLSPQSSMLAATPSTAAAVTANAQ
jgi:1-acyl-sn-glycerol-3-phosphate acyltransferase